MLGQQAQLHIRTFHRATCDGQLPINSRECIEMSNLDGTGDESDHKDAPAQAQQQSAPMLGCSRRHYNDGRHQQTELNTQRSRDDEGIQCLGDRTTPNPGTREMPEPVDRHPRRESHPHQGCCQGDGSRHGHVQPQSQRDTGHGPCPSRQHGHTEDGPPQRVRGESVSGHEDDGEHSGHCGRGHYRAEQDTPP